MLSLSLLFHIASVLAFVALGYFLFIQKSQITLMSAMLGANHLKVRVDDLRDALNRQSTIMKIEFVDLSKSPKKLTKISYLKLRRFLELSSVRRIVVSEEESKNIIFRFYVPALLESDTISLQNEWSSLSHQKLILESFE